MLKLVTAGSIAPFALALAVATPAQGAQIWNSTFDSSADGVVDVVDGNLGKDLIGVASGGSLQINMVDQSGAFNDNDRGGRALGSTLDGNASFSGLYQFNFSDLNEDSTQMWEFVGFIGNSANIAQQHVGVMMRHSKVGVNYFTTLDLVYGSDGAPVQVFDATGTGGYGPLAPTSILLGPDAEGRDLQLVIGYDGSTHVLNAALYDADDNLLSGNTRDMDDLTTSPAFTDLAVTHLGWSEYVATGAGRTATWQVDSLSYYDDATGAFDALVPEPGSVSLIAMGVLGVFSRRRRVG